MNRLILLSLFLWMEGCVIVQSQEELNNQSDKTSRLHQEEQVKSQKFNNVADFTQFVVAQAYTFDESQEETQNKSRPYFTNNGFISYSKSIVDTGLINGLHEKYSKIEFKIDQNPVITFHKKFGNVEKWGLKTQGILIKNTNQIDGRTKFHKINRKNSEVNLIVIKKTNGDTYQIDKIINTNLGNIIYEEK